MRNAQWDFDDSFSRPRSTWPLRVFWLVAIVLPILLIAVLLFVPWPEEKVTAANFRAIRVGISMSDLRESLGVPRYESVEMGLVAGPASYTVNFAQSESELRSHGYKQYARYVWMSPEITITSIVDSDEKVVCVYSRGGQARDLRGFLGFTKTQRLRPGNAN